MSRLFAPTLFAPTLFALTATILVSMSVGGGNVAHAEEFEPEMGAEYLWDGGVVPFLYGSAAVAIGLRLFGEPVDDPNLFPDSEGGLSSVDNTVPELAVVAYTLGFTGIIAATPKAERWHHFKGFGQAILTTIAVTEIAKDAVGRHRPHYQEGSDNPDHRRSFFSGHASITAAGTVYMGLYLSRNLMPKPSLLKTGGLLLLGGLFVGVPLSRVEDNRHHLSDVVTGAAVGSALATAFYVYQESRFRDEEESYWSGKRNRIQIVPNLRNPGLTVQARW